MKYLSLLLVLAPGIASAFTIGPSSPGKWGNPTFGTGAAISYSFIPTEVDCSVESVGNCTGFAEFLPNGYETEIQRALNAWSSVANITFTQVVDDGTPLNSTTNSGNIRFGGHSIDGASGTLAHGFFPPANGNSIAGDIHFDIAENWTINNAIGIDIYWVALHEIGHALGLGHEENSNILAVMNPFYNPTLSFLQADDIVGIQTIYGPAAVPLPSAIWLFITCILGLSSTFRKIS